MTPTAVVEHQVARDVGPPPPLTFTPAAGTLLDQASPAWGAAFVDQRSESLRRTAAAIAALDVQRRELVAARDRDVDAMLDAGVPAALAAAAAGVTRQAVEKRRASSAG